MRLDRASPVARVRLSSVIPMLRRKTFLLITAVIGMTVSLPTGARGQKDRGQLSAPFLDNLVGSWSISRQIRGTVLGSSLDVQRVLNHPFVQLHMRGSWTPPAHEALILVGYDASTSDTAQARAACSPGLATFLSPVPRRDLFVSPVGVSGVSRSLVTGPSDPVRTLPASGPFP